MHSKSKELTLPMHDANLNAQQSKRNSKKLDEDDQYSVSLEVKILRLVYQNDTKALKELKIQIRDVNFLEEFKDVDIDNYISPLHLAAFTGKIEVVKLLLENDVIDLDLQTKTSGFTATSIACATGNYEILRLLVENGADINKENNFEQPALFYCFTRLQEETNLFENQLICMKMADLLLQYGANIDYLVDKKKKLTLLMQFCKLKIELGPREKDINKKVIIFLLERGANRYLKSAKGKTAFDLAEKHTNKTEILHILKTVQHTVFYSESVKMDSSMFKINKKTPLLAEGTTTGGFCDLFRWCKKLQLKSMGL